MPHTDASEWLSRCALNAHCQPYKIYTCPAIKTTFITSDNQARGSWSRSCWSTLVDAIFSIFTNLCQFVYLCCHSAAQVETPLAPTSGPRPVITICYRFNLISMETHGLHCGWLPYVAVNSIRKTWLCFSLDIWAALTFSAVPITSSI